MYLYNIHTHKVDSSKEGGYDVQCILNTYPEDFEEKKQTYPDAWFSCGIHPWYADKQDLDLLKEIVKEDRVVAIGEAGLDKLQGPNLSFQIDIFRQQIELSISANKPLIIHCVKAWDELIALYREYKNTPSWIIHGYRGNVEQTKQLSKLGFKFSVGEKFNPESIRHIPQDSIFCETDTSILTICKVYENISKEISVNLNHFAILAEKNVKNTFHQMTYIQNND